MSDQTKVPGRPGIDEQAYVKQIQGWLDDGLRIDDITATQLQKAIGGQYRKAANILEKFKEGYTTKELSDLPPVPDELANKLNSAALEAWRILWNAKTKAVEEATQVFEGERQKLKAVNEERLDRIGALEDELTESRMLVAELKAALQKSQEAEKILSDAHHKGQMELAQKREEVKQIQIRLDDKAVALVSTNEDLTDSRRQLEQERKNSTELAAKVRDTKAELTQALADNKRLSADLKRQAEDISQKDRQAEQAAQQLTTAAEQARTLEKEVSRAQACEKLLTEERDGLKERLDKLSDENHQLWTARDEAQDKVLALEVKLARLEKTEEPEQASEAKEESPEPEQEQKPRQAPEDWGYVWTCDKCNQELTAADAQTLRKLKKEHRASCGKDSEEWQCPNCGRGSSDCDGFDCQ